MAQQRAVPPSGRGLRLQLLGGFRAWVGDRPVPEAAWDGRSAALVALLALSPGHRLHRDQALDLLWPHLDRDAAANNLHGVLHRARRALEPERAPGAPSAYLALRGDLLQLGPAAPLCVDLDAFEAAAADALGGADPARYRAALARYRGDLLPEDRTVDWLRERREAARRRTLELARRLAAIEEARGEAEPPLARRRGNLPLPLAECVGREPDLAALDPLLQPGPRAQRLVTLVGPGGAGKTRLALEAGRHLADAYAGGVWLLELDALADPRLLPSALAATLGVREQGGQDPLTMLAAALRPRTLLLLLDNCEHLLDAVAPAAATLLRACPGLAILATSREALGAAGEVVRPVAPLAAPDPALLPRLDDLQAMPAVRLFLERAQAVRPGIALTPENAPAVARICHRLDGLPLAIELAAARLSALPVADLADRLDEALAAPGRANRIAPPRHQSLQALLDWGDALLGEPERRLFRRLAVFARGWTLAAARAVCAGDDLGAGDLPALLRRLVDRSLVLAEEPARTDPQGARYRLLETIRRYAAERLEAAGEAATVRGRHARWVAALAEEAGPALLGPEQAAWLDRLAAEHGNLRAALRWAAEQGDAAQGARICAGAWRYWWARGHLGEGRHRLAAALANAAVVPAPMRAELTRGAAYLARAVGERAEAERLLRQQLALREALADAAGVARALDDLGMVVCERRDYAEAGALHERSLALFREQGDRAGIADALTNLGRVLSDRGDHARAAALHAESLALRRALGDDAGTAYALENLAVVAYDQADHATAGERLAEALDLRRRLGDQEGMARALNGLGLVALALGDPRRSVALQEEGLALRRALGATWGTAISLYGLALALAARGEAARAAALHAEALPLFAEVGDRRGLAQGLEALAALGARSGAAAGAARLLGAAEALRAAIGAPQAPVGQAEQERTLMAPRRALGATALAAARAAGRALPPEGALAEALDLAARLSTAATVEAQQRRRPPGPGPSPAPAQASRSQRWGHPATAPGDGASPKRRARHTAAGGRGSAAAEGNELWAAAAEADASVARTGYRQNVAATGPAEADASVASVALSEAQWAAVAALLDGRRTEIGRPARGDRAVVEGILWALRTGADWRRLPTAYGHWKTVAGRYYRWRDSGLWPQIERALEAEPAASSRAG